MKTSDFDYSLPEDLIAQSPPAKRGESRLLVLKRKEGEVLHRSFSNLIDFLDEKDALVFNNTRVIPARLYGQKASGGKVEALLLREVEGHLWEAMLKSSKSPKKGSPLLFGGELKARVEEKRGDTCLLSFSCAGSVKEAIGRYGEMPLPPYIKRPAVKEDEERYQTVYSSMEGAVAAPTAGLHFTLPVLEEIKNKGISVEMITLHVGPGTFQPVRAENLDDHKMHREYFMIDEETAQRINSAKERGGRVVAVGTTALRALESSTLNGKVLPNKDWTDIFVRPGYGFNIVDCMVTNFHLPKSTLFMLVSAFAGTDVMKRVYERAVKERYRFFSYGDAMLIL
ncbi:MAG: tRNA preQ1(34) S-adenosylmethionine ribosyltransferase-isomerase QueA [Deltaproteobacteria bacterium]|nr:tRNA preQ1(34) S-adenosylmethionine ribosyltransferase-isomerase QueA [Deltaproteobacteria bacterium]